MVKRTVTEWLGELNLLEKKIKKEYEILEKSNLYSVEFKENSELYSSKISEEEAYVKSHYESLEQLIKNREKIRAALLAFNATNYITIDGKDYLIALALEKIKNKEIINILPVINKQLTKLSADEIRFNSLKENKREELLDSLSNKANSSSVKDMEAIDRQMEKYTVVTKQYLPLKEIYDKITNEKLTFEEYVNVQLNIKNATTILEIDY